MRRVAILDLETDGLDPAVNRCIEAAVVLYDLEHAAAISSFACLMNAEANAAESVNRIPAQLLADALPASDVWRRVRWHIERADAVVAHRAEFDRSFTPAEIVALRPWVCSKFAITWPHGKPGDHLVHLALAHGVGVVHAHRAATDVDILARLFTRVHEMGHPLPELVKRAMRPRVKVQALVSYDDREMAKQASFAWDPAQRVWWREMFVDEVGALPFQTRTL